MSDNKWKDEKAEQWRNRTKSINQEAKRMLTFSWREDSTEALKKTHIKQISIETTNGVWPTLKLRVTERSDQAEASTAKNNGWVLIELCQFRLELSVIKWRINPLET